jgi:hypothetical protein
LLARCAAPLLRSRSAPARAAPRTLCDSAAPRSPAA